VSVPSAAAAPDALPAHPAAALATPRLGQVSAAEWRWLGGIGLLLLALLTLPYLVWLLWGPADLVHVGSFWYPRDFTVYLAAMQQGAQSSSWLIYDRFTPEPHDPVFMFPVYVAIGKIAAVVGATPLAVYYAGEVLARVGLLAALYAFAAAVLPTIGQRRLALALMLLGTNLGLWAAVLVEPLARLTGQTEGLPLGAELEVMTLGVFLAPLHLMLGLTFTLLCVVAFAAAVAPTAGWRTRLALAGTVLGLSLVHPFNLPVVGGVFGVYTALQLARTRRWPGAAVVATVLAGLVALPFLAYNYYTFRIEPFWSVVYGQQNTVPSPSPLRLFMDYGLVLALAPAALKAWRRPWSDRQWLYLLWAALLLLALYSPVPFQRRLAFGLQPGLAVLAAAALTWWASRLSARGRRWLGWGVALAALPTAAFLYAGMVLSAATNAPVEVYVAHRAEWEAGEWLARQIAASDVVLASEDSGFWLAALIPGRVWLGHKGITYDVPTKRAVVADVLAGPPDRAAQLLREHRITYLYYGPREREQGALQEGPGLRRVYASPEVEIFRPEPASSP